MYKTIQACRACGYGAVKAVGGIKSTSTQEKLLPVFSLGLQPLANDFWADGSEQSGYAPLEVMFCPRCTLAQLSVVVRPDILYRNYTYVTSPSAMMQRHLERLYADLARWSGGMNRVLEVGSNDGRFLHFITSHGHKVCGIDPAENLHPNTVESICDTLCYGSAEQARFKLEGPADVVIARHVFCHVEDWLEFMRSLEVVTHPESLVAIEVPYVGKLLAGLEFDTIYHEHTSYLGFKAMAALLERTEFRIHDIIDYDIHGGAILFLLRSKQSQVAPNEEAMRRVQEESITPSHWAEFSRKATSLIGEIMGTVVGLRKAGKTVCVFGASAKSTVLINACTFTRNDISFICDSTKGKWFRFSPGQRIPVLDEGALLRELPNYALMCCWNFASEVMNNQKLYLEKGGKFIMPLPTVKIVP